MRSRLGLDVELVSTNKTGLFEVRVDDRPVVVRKGGIVALLTRRGWPSDDEVVDAVRAATAG